MIVNRRSFIASAGITAAAGLVAPVARAQARQARKVAIPPLAPGRREGGRLRFDLDIRQATTEFYAGYATPTIGIGGTFMGPVLRARAGDHVEIAVRNGLAEPTTLHWHGLHVPAAMDGGPHQVIEPGRTWSPSFVIRQKASLCWYHSHLMGKTGEQVLRGLCGLFLIDDEESARLGLPSEYGVDDIPLVLQDRRFNRDGSFQYIASMHDVMAGYKGDVMLVNGTVEPYLELRRRRTRLRLLNASNSRIYTLGRGDGRELVVIGVDGSLLERPARQQRLRLAPGERAELLVDAEDGQRIVLMSYPDTAGAGPGGGMGAMAGNLETFPVIELRAERLAASNLALPERLIEVPSWTPAMASRRRSFTLDMAMMGGGMGRGSGSGRMGVGLGGMMGINGRTMDMQRIDERVPLGAVEIWEIRNPGPMAHPFHIHNVMFRVLDRDGRPPQPHELGLKDTVLVDPGSTVRFITEFADYADAEHPYMYHCHILEHEDAGMMGQFLVV